jgi:glutathione S-transferase
MIDLYGFCASTIRKLQWVLEEVGAPYAFHRLNILAGENRTPQFLALSPTGRIPLLVDGGYILGESNAILWYVAEKYGQGRLVPSQVEDEARIHSWLSLEATDGGKTIHEAWLEVVTRVMGQFRGRGYDPRIHDSCREAAYELLGRVESRLDEGPFLVGDRFSIADIAIGSLIDECGLAEIGLGAFPEIRGWMRALAARPGFQASAAVGGLPQDLLSAVASDRMPQYLQVAQARPPGLRVAQGVGISAARPANGVSAQGANGAGRSSLLGSLAPTDLDEDAADHEADEQVDSSPGRLDTAQILAALADLTHAVTTLVSRSGTQLEEPKASRQAMAKPGGSSVAGGRSRSHR